MGGGVLVIVVVNKVFLKRCHVDEVLIDNETAFRSAVMKEMLDRWNVKCYFRAVYKPSGKSIVKRHHRTIKIIIKKGCISPLTVVFYFFIFLL